MGDGTRGGSLIRPATGLAAAVALALAAGCERDPLDIPCPDVAVGGLVVTELHRAPYPDDDQGNPVPAQNWIELYNASAAPVDLTGLTVIHRSPTSDSSVDRILLSGSGVTIGAQDYVVLGRLDDDFVNYVFGEGIDRPLRENGVIRLESCGVLIDQVVYDRLGDDATKGLDGTVDPDATANDESANWCENPDPAGTPGERNPPCG